MHGMQHISNGRFSSVACPHYGAYTYGAKYKLCNIHYYSKARKAYRKASSSIVNSHDV